MPSFKDKKHSIKLSQDFGRLFRYGPSENGRPEKVDEMYTLKWNCFDHSDVQKGIDNVLGPLSLFAPANNEDAVTAVEQIEPERSITPIDDEIKTQPQTFDKIAHYVGRRITAKPNVPYLSAEDQKNLAAIIMGELNGIWPDIHRQIDDPFLTVSENKELYRRIAVHIVTVCEQLFNHYLNKAQVLNKRGVFSGPANMSRLKVQLALEANEMLNILKIRRYIVNDIRMSAAGQTAVAESSPRSTKSTASRKSLGTTAMFNDRCSSTKRQKTRINTTEHELHEILNSMPVLDTSNFMELLADLPERRLHSSSEEALHARPSRISGGVSVSAGVIKDDSSKQKATLKRCNSQPLFDDGGNLLEELDIDHRVKSDKLIELELELLQRERHGLLKYVQTDKETQVHLGSRDFIENDLKKLTECKKDEFLGGNSEDDLPPLVQAITRHARHDDLKQRMEKQLIELEDRQKMREEKECIHVRDATHPQPDTVIAKLGNAGVVRTSDIRVSERVCMSSMTLRRYATVYNDLLEEISHDTVKNLDKNLFLSDEIHEVYKEIMKTVPSTHMELDDDPLVLNAPDSLDLANMMASATLSCKVIDRIINPAFRRDREPPWTDGDRTEWAKIPANPPKNMKGEDLFGAMAPTMPKIHDVINNFEHTMQTGKLNVGEEKMFRTYTSWLQWWKSTVTSDDYMKYLSVQETDFLAALFHLYDSEEDDESENDESTNKMLHHSSRRTHTNTRGKVSTEERERIRKLKDLQNVKSEYKKGFWNANAVLMGGLGRDPEIADEKPKEGSSMRSAERSHHKQASHLKITQDNRDRSQCGSKTTTKISEHTFEDLQGRLESVWQKLQVPDSQRLDMAIKYSCDGYFSHLTEAIERWEFVSQLIVQRETLLVKLETFERQASDPNRFFAKDSKNSIYRLEESRQRAGLYKKIDSLDANIKEDVEYIQSKFHDVITYKGRPYIDKMKWDRTEMLYWLSEERKQNGLKYEALIQGLSLPLKPAQLQPISSSKPVQK